MTELREKVEALVNRAWGWTASRKAATDAILALLAEDRRELVKVAFEAGAVWCRRKIVTYLSTPAGGLECVSIAAQDYLAALAKEEK